MNANGLPPKLHRMQLEATHFGWSKAQLEALAPEARQWLTVEPAPEKYPDLYNQAMAQADALSTQSPNTRNIIISPVATGGTLANGVEMPIYNMLNPSPIFGMADRLGTNEAVAFRNLRNSVEPEYKEVLGVNILVGTPEGKQDEAAKGTLLMVKLQGRMCLSQLVVPSEQQRKDLGTNAQLTVDLAGHTLETNARPGQFSGHKIGQPAQHGDYVTYDWRRGGHVMRYVWDGQIYADHEEWLPLRDPRDPDEFDEVSYDDRGNFDTRGQRMEAHAPYNPSQYPRVALDTERAVLKALQSAEPYLDPTANTNFFPPLVW